MSAVLPRCFASHRKYSSRSTHLLRRLVHVPTTGSRLPYLRRKPFSKVTEHDVNHFQRLLSDGRVLSTVDDVAAHCTDWLKLYRGEGSIVLKPSTVEEVSAVLSYCHARNLAVVPQGGMTGLVGGGVPVFDEVVLSLSLMNKIIKIDPVAGLLVCQAGCVLQKLDEELAEHGMIMPLDLGAKGSCHIGGNVATNAGGIRLLRYGSMHGNVLGLEVVLADGTVVDTLTTNRKDNTGYDVKQLFIGSEGTLGVVTAVAIATPPKPKAVTVCFLGCQMFTDVLGTFHAAKQSLGEILSACEFMDGPAMAMIERNLGLVNPLGQAYPFYVLIETSGSDAQHDEEKVAKFVEAGSSFENGTLATEPSKIQAIWALRERLAEGLLHDGIQHKFDVSLPLEVYYDLVEVMRERVQSLAVSCVGYGHVGDGNLHLNITSREHNKDLEKAISPFLYDWTASHRGSISAEHGLGIMKPQYIGHSKTPAAISLMRNIKSSMDPKGILNPYKVLQAD